MREVATHGEQPCACIHFRPWGWEKVAAPQLLLLASVLECKVLVMVDRDRATAGHCTDVGMIFWGHVRVEILTTLFGTLHPSFYAAYHEAFIYEQRWMFQAYIPWDRGDF